MKLRVVSGFLLGNKCTAEGSSGTSAFTSAVVNLQLLKIHRHQNHAQSYYTYRQILLSWFRYLHCHFLHWYEKD